MDATGDVDRLAGVLPLGSIIRFPDLLLGGGLLVAVVPIGARPLSSPPTPTRRWATANSCFPRSGT